MKIEELTSRLFLHLGIYTLILLFIYITRYIAKINKKNSLENELEKLYEIEEFLDKYEKRKLLNNKTWNSILLTGETLWYKFLKIF